ncbi:hypothetical protein [Brevibacillus sp. HD3.3A]|uniref:hypothetical protein n=1 Tax=Brevibacillus sp. HD3.3A TaxID=2738979 RepID=UPI00156A7873|nr:hypothetical protein [Brevibacillus sp. HD3.3A]UED70759.1 hypothetical protein HP435_09010 [Brevibacillus sp. HD3.3A]
MRFVGIDPSTKTGFVALDEQGNVLRQKELTGVGDIDPYRMRTLIHEVKDHVQKGDLVCIEGFGFASQQAVQLGGIGWGMRMMLEARGISYYEPAPNQVKKFVGASGGKRGRTEKEKKAAMIAAVTEHFGFEHASHNVVDAYILAQIARCLYLKEKGIDMIRHKYQAEVLHAILNPPQRKVRKKVAK